MGIGIEFSGKLKDVSILTNYLQEICETKRYNLSSDENRFALSFFNLGTIFFEITEKKNLLKRDITFSADAQTNLLGAGYHCFVVDFIDNLKKELQIEIKVEDETNFYDDRDFEQMRQNHFYSYLNNIVDLIVENSEEEDYENFLISWDLNNYKPETTDDTFISPFGRFSILDTVEKIEKQDVEAFAKEFFIWNEIEKDAPYYQKTALNLLWEKIHFAPFLDKEDEERDVKTAIAMLEKAVSLDKNIPIPIDDYLYLCELAEHTPIDTSVLVNYVCEYPIGFRKDIVTETIGTCSFALPGHLYYEYNEEKNSPMFINQNDETEDLFNIRVAAYTFDSDSEFPDQFFENSEEPAEIVTRLKEGEECKVGFMSSQEDGEDPYYISQAICVTEGQITILTFSYPNKDYRATVLKLLEK